MSRSRPGSGCAVGVFSEDGRALRKVDVLEPLSDTEIEDLMGRLPTMSFQKGNILFTPVHHGNLSFFLLEGSVRLYKACEGRELTLEIVHAGSIFSNSSPAAQRESRYSEESTGMNCGLYAQTLRPARVAMIRHEHFRKFILEHPEVGLKAMANLERRLSFYAERMFDLGTREIPARLARLILWLLEDEGVVSNEGLKISTRYTHEELATMIGSRRVAITRALRELQNNGVELKSRHIHVMDMEALRCVAA
ncbi:MAG: Crp/Fnr family transcriptional regulator [Rubrobacter sp.]|nr:Crp/Fnr family transcriptional regulator [Rubrobacter sp.]